MGVLMAKIIMFSMKGCANCEQAARIIEEKGVPFSVEKVDENEDAFRHMQVLGLRSLPQFFIGRSDTRYDYFCDYKSLTKLTDEQWEALK
jgi:glutaredoxin